MAEKLQCPECGRDYPHEKRLAGRPVQCRHCGHRFLAPMWSETPGASSAVRPGPAPHGPATPSSNLAAARIRTPQPSTTPAPPQPPGPPAEEDELEVLEVEIIDEPVYQAKLAAPQAELLPVPPVPRGPALRRGPTGVRPAPRRREAAPASRAAGSAWKAVIAGASVAVLLVAAIVFWIFHKPAGAPGAGDGPAPANASTATTPAAPAPSGQPITLWGAKCSGLGGMQTTFSVDYRLDGFQPQASAVYHWFVSGPAGEVKFDITGNQFRPSGTLRGGPMDTRGAQGPLTAYLEMDAPAGAPAKRISNTVPVEIGT